MAWYRHTSLPFLPISPFFLKGIIVYDSTMGFCPSVIKKVLYSSFVGYWLPQRYLEVSNGAICVRAGYNGGWSRQKDQT
jgi:hypothetical protein